MTLVQTQFRPASAHRVHSTVADTMDAAGPQVWEDMTVEVALAVMAAARTGHLVVCDDDGLCTGLVTRARLTVVRDSSGSTDRIRLRDIVDVIAPFASPLTTRTEAERAMRRRRLGALPVVDEQGNALGVLALSR
ncbi:CBS domain containing protein [Streptomyces caelestis]|uniref:CBS domain containing protein n=2 Tax=Streptomyces TaxID=1883 RepID=A0A0M8QE10_9ACTN|nr:MULTISPECIES: CBS domain-containing protein [Streptomyces]KOT31243.1 CBS domain containing protein [Streptomyces caelestis]KOV21733.1 CBS domain containing protein [Streptomyces sp. XY152]